MSGKYTKEELCYIWLDSFLGLEYKYKSQIIQLLDFNEYSFNISAQREYLIPLLGASVYQRLLSSANEIYLSYILDGLDKRGIKAITCVSHGYPSCFLQTDYPPFVIYAKGDERLLLKNDIFGIVGSRKSLPISLKLAQSYSESLLEAGFVLATGTASGVDAQVLTTALNKNGKVISVVAGGFDNIYPQTNKDLVERVGRAGLIISEYPPEITTKPFHFPIRNRIISALSRGVLIVSGGMKSGTLYTAEYAEEYGKDLFAIPYSVGVFSGAGCNDLIKRGAILTDSPQDILEFYGKTKATSAPILSDFEKEVIKALENGEQHIEAISSKLNKRAYELTPTLSVLEIKGLIIKSGNIYGLTGNYSED